MPSTRADTDTLDRILATPIAERTVLIQGATILSMDDAVGDLARGDILIRGSRIQAVAPDLSAAASDGAAITVDADGAIAIPGLQDSHRHSWQTQIRRLLCDINLEDYFDIAHGRLAPVWRPEDMYLGTRLAALTALQSGITSVLDFSPNWRTSEHGAQALRAWEESGLRATVVPVRPIAGEWDQIWESDLRRLRETTFASDAQCMRLRVGGYVRSVPVVADEIELGADTVALARELGLGITVDAVFGPGASEHLAELGDAGLLSSEMTFIHCQSLDDRAWDALAGAGASVVLAATSDAQLGCVDSVPPIQAALDRDLIPGLSIDVECSLSSDLFTQMRMALNVQRMMAYQRHNHGDDSAPAVIPVRDALRYATTAGAAANGVADIAGSLSPGKAADLVLIRGDDVENLPLNSAVGTVVMGTDSANVDAVFVDGEPRKWGGELVGVDVEQLRRDVAASRDWLLEQIDYPLAVV